MIYYRVYRKVGGGSMALVGLQGDLPLEATWQLFF